MKRHPHYIELDIKKMHELYSAGLSQVQLSRHFGVGQFVISRRLFPEKYKDYDRIRNTKRKRKNKKLLVEYKMGSCQMPGCNYNKCFDALDFHHIDKKEKLFSISSKRSHNLNSLKKEADKTILLCRNCHGEVHAGMHEEFMKRTLEIYRAEKLCSLKGGFPSSLKI